MKFIRKIIAALLLMVWPSLTFNSASGQRSVFFAQNQTASVGVCASKIDPFTGSGALSSCWSQTTASGYGTLTRNTGVVVATGTKGIINYTGGTFTTTQSSTWTVPSTLTNSITGPAVLMQVNGSGYLWEIVNQGILPVNAGAGTSFISGSCPAVSAGDVVKLSVTVTASVPTITCLDVTTGLSASATDTNSCGGSPCSITGVPGAFVAGSDKLTNFIGT